MPDTVQDKLPDLATIQPDRLIKCHISEDRYSGEVLLPGLWYTDFDRKTGGQWSFWAISKTFEAVNLYGWMNGLLFYYDLVSGRDRTFFNASNVIRLNRKASEINYDSYYGLNRPFRFTLCVSYIGRTSFTLSVVMFDHLTGEKYGDCNSTIVYVDTKTRRPVPLPEDLIVGAKTALEKLKVKPYNVEKSGLFKVPPEALSYKLKVLHSDCDRNQHVNQSTYIRWCSDSLYYNLFKGLNLSGNMDNPGILMKEIKEQYIGEAVVNDIVFVYMWETCGQICFAITDGKGNQIFNAKLSLHNATTLKLSHNQKIENMSKL